MRIVALTPDEFAQHQHLFQEHWRELGWAQEFDFKPDPAVYQRLYDAGVWMCLGARNRIGMLAGYATACIVPSAMNPGVTICTVESVYVLPYLRGTSISGRLIHGLEAAAQERGAQHIVWQAPVGSDFQGALVKHGYTARTVCMTRRLNHVG
jgi:GNAT superfamily N-acetyltransferase